jgi:fructose-1,6-bisphosphatase/inositol monophosphatase family enzyme
MPYQSELETALAIARKAGELALSHFSRKTETFEKVDHSPVTIADQECEELISRLLSESYPGDGILGEEGTRVSSQTGRRWIVDPIDGTRDFVRRNPHWAIQIALESEDKIVLGVIHFPCLDETIHATFQGGCFWNGKPSRASGIDRLDQAILMVSGFKSAWETWPPEQVRYLTEKCWTVRCYGGCYDVAMIARGKADIWLSGSGMPWDYAPAQIVAHECGAHFLTKDGSSRIDADHCIVCAPGLVEELRRILSLGR